MILIMLPIFNIVYGQDKIDIKKMEIKYDAIQMNFQEFQRLIYPEFEIHDKNDSIYILLDKKIIGVNKESLDKRNNSLVDSYFAWMPLYVDTDLALRASTFKKRLFNSFT